MPRHAVSTSFKKGNIPWDKGKHHTEAAKLKMSLAKQGKYNGVDNPMYGVKRPIALRQFLSNLKKEQYKNPLARQQLSESIRSLWTNPDYVARVIKGRKARPTKPERILIDILSEHLPNQFGYNGDFSLGVMLAGLIPDFVNTNGRKEVIEVFGDFFHSDKVKKKWHATELGRIMAYNAIGYKCLVLWESEIERLSEETIAAKILQFFRSRRNAIRLTG